MKSRSKLYSGMALVLSSCLSLAAANAAVTSGAKSAALEPILASAEQDEAEELLLALLADPDVRGMQEVLHAQLLATPIGQTRDGAATLKHAIACWTTSLIQKEISTYRARPAFLWGSEDTPHDWRGRHIPCAGVAGDNPDNIYRTAVVQGGARYEISGKFNPASRPTQVIVQIGSGEMSIVPDLRKAGPEMVSVLAAFEDSGIDIAADGSFRITVGGETGAKNHVVTPPGPVYVGFRDSLSDWRQEPIRLSLKRLDAGPDLPFDRAELRRRIVGRIGDYARGWSVFPSVGWGGLGPNTHSEAIGREGGWGFVAGVRFSLAADEAAVVTISRGEAQYLGFQVVDPWTIAGDARKRLTSLNRAQSTPDRNGDYTYVISPVDPGVANWLDTNGLGDGFGVIRWQKVPRDMPGKGLIRNFRIIKAKDATGLPGIARITPQQRKAQLEKREKEWALRLR